MRAYLALIPLVLLAADADYEAGIRKWRADRETRLKAEDGWLTLVGLHWLKEGDNPFGAGPGGGVELGPGASPQAGILRLRAGTVTLIPSGSALRLQGKPVAAPTVLKTDRSGAPDIIELGRLKLHVIERGSQFGVRVKDPQSEYRRNFKGLSWFPVDAAWKVRARFVPEPREMVFDAQAGDKQRMTSPGYVEWTWRGQKLRLTPVSEGSQLFFIFRDRTAGKQTYAAARFLYADPPKDGFVTLDFNKAYNPPCVFTPYATCPLPPPENRLAIRVEAGEKMYQGGH